MAVLSFEAKLIIYSYSQPSQDIKPKRELRRFAPQLSFGFWLCLNIDVYSYNSLDASSFF
ncbi:hypothetical protein B9G53_19315 [Pseudanabaena sp. SR411]|nr:hypothetical protein B9G53_19315 [Pseudanabaena sp. SR411]